MMIGTNQIVLNHSMMVAALQHYFDTVMFKDAQSPLITHVVRDNNGVVNTFTVHTGERPEPFGDQAP